MSTLYHLNFSGKNILYQVDDYSKYFFQGEIVFPYHFKFDYFSEKATFTDEGINKVVQDFIENIYLTLNDLLEKEENLRQDLQKFRFYNKHIELQKEDIRKCVIELFIIRNSSFYIGENWGLTLMNEVTNEFYEILTRDQNFKMKKSEFEYDEIFKEHIYRHRKIIEVNRNDELVYDFTLIERFIAATGYGHYKFKQLGYTSNRHMIPKQFIEDCDLEKYLLKEEERIPLIIGTQFGTTPKITREFTAKLEGQEVIFLSKSALSGHEHSLVLKKVVNGEYQVITEIIRNKD